MNFSFDRFLKPLTSSDKNIKIYDTNNVVKYIINPFNVKTLNISNNLITIKLESDRNIVLDFSTQNETKQAIQKLQIYLDTLKNSIVPYYIQHAVELEAPNFTKGPTGSIGGIGPIGSTGERGDEGKSAYQVWLNTHNGTEIDFITSITGPIGPTGPTTFGNTGELEVVDQTIKALVENKDIEIVTKGSGNLLFKIDRDGWVLKYGLLKNNVGEIWGSGSTIDDEGNIYTTGADYVSIATYITKTAKNGQLIWQKQVDFYSQGESIIFSNGFIYILANSLDYSLFPQIIKLNKNGEIINLWNFDVNIDGITSNPDYMLLSEIAIDEDDNIYYVGSQYNSPDINDLAYGITDMVVGKLNTTTLQSEWFKVIDGNLGYKDSGYSIKYKNGWVYTTGVVYNDAGGIKGDAFVSKIDKSGNISWAKAIGNGNYVEGISLTIDNDDNLYVSGYYEGVDFKNYYMKLDTFGNIVWSKCINNFKRTITTIEESGDYLFIVSTQAVSSTPSRQSTDLYLAKILKSNGDIEWQQYIYTDYRDSIWGLLPSVFPATGHRSITIDPTDESIYITGLTVEGDYSLETPIAPGSPLLSEYPSGIFDIYHNSFLMSYDKKSLPEGPYGNWNIQNATFSISDLNLNISNIIDTSINISNSLKDGFIPTITEVVGNTIPTNKDSELTLFSPNTQLYVKGILNVDDLYTLPRSAGTKGQILTYGESGSLLEWKLPTITFGFNDYEEIVNNILGATGMDGIFVDPNLGAINGQFDDEYFEVAAPFQISFMGVSYSTIYVGSNSYITFGDGYSNSGGYTRNNPPLPGIFIGAGDRSCQSLYTKTTADKFIIRYEGSVSPSGASTPPFIEIEWEITFNKNSSTIEVNIGNNDTYFTNDGSTYIKNTNDIYKDLILPPSSAFRILKGYGYRPVQANRLNYINIEGLSYSIIEDPINLGDDIVSIDFSELVGAGKFYYQSNPPTTNSASGIRPGTLWYDSDQGYLYVYVKDANTAQWVTQFNIVGPAGPKGDDGSFTTLSSTGSNIFLDSNQNFHILSGIQSGNDQSVYTLEYFGSDQGMYLQSKIPIIEDDQDQIRFGIKDSNGDWAYHVKLTHNTPSLGQMIIYDAYGNDLNNQVLDYSQTYAHDDILTIYIDGEKVYYKINGITLLSIDFIVTNPSLSYRFFCETFVGEYPSNTLSMDYDFYNLKFYPIAPISKSKNFLSISTKTSDYIITLDDYTIRVDATNNDVTVTLPTASSSYSNGRGYEFVIKRVDNSLNNVYLNGNSGELIDIYTTNGLTLLSLEKVRVQSNGVNWDIL